MVWKQPKCWTRQAVETPFVQPCFTGLSMAGHLIDVLPLEIASERSRSPVAAAKIMLWCEMIWRCDETDLPSLVLLCLKRSFALWLAGRQQGHFRMSKVGLLSAKP